MAKLSNKQQTILEHKWELERQVEELTIRIADETSEARAQLRQLRTAIDAIEDQVPDTVQDAWDAEDSAKMRERREGRWGVLAAAKDLIKELV